MNAQSRRNAIMEVLKAEEKPVSASTLAKQFNVSRQIIVGDIALLRAGGADISAPQRAMSWHGSGRVSCGASSVSTAGWRRWRRS